MSETEKIIMERLDRIERELRESAIKAHAFNPEVKELDIEHFAVYTNICRSDLEMLRPFFPELIPHTQGRGKKLYWKKDFDNLKKNTVQWQKLNEILKARGQKKKQVCAEQTTL